MSVPESHLQPASSVPLNSQQFALSTVCRFLQGLTAVVPLLVIFQYPDQQSAIVGCQLCIAAMLCGAALSLGIERGVARLVGIHAGCLMAVVFSTLGLFLIQAGCPVDFWPLPCLVIGLGIGSDWSGVSEVARRSLSTTLRWQGLRVWSVAFPAGSAIGILLITNAPLVRFFFFFAMALSVAVFALLLFGKRLAAIRPTPDAPDGVPSNSTESDEPDEGDAAGECDAVECCGGGIRELQPTPFWHGVLLAASGVLVSFLIPWFVLVSGLQTQRGATYEAYAITAFALGLPMGAWLIISAAPRIGYVVAVLPFCLLSLVATGIYGFVSLSGLTLTLVAFCCGLFSAGVATGVSAIAGELFSDCPTDAKRSSVLSMALFASAAVVSALSVVQTISPSHAATAASLPVLCVIGLLTVRSLPSPVISSLGKDDDGSSEDEELKDVIARISKTP